MSRALAARHHDLVSKRQVERQRTKIEVMPRWAIWLGAAVLLLLAVGSTWLLLSLFNAGTSQDRTRLEAVKTSGSVVIGTGGAVALLLAARRQRSAEIALRLQNEELRQKEQAAFDVQHDASERRITDTYTAAVDQLGSDKAAVRFGGLYALERLAQDAPSHRQAIVEVVCAYLRMPDPDESTDARDYDDMAPEEVLGEEALKQRREEHQVRRAAQRILTGHLRRRPDHDGHVNDRNFWPDIDIDLNGASLKNWNFDHCHPRRATFSRARFYGATSFHGATFHGRAWLRRAQFHADAIFENVEFHDEADFSKTRFEGSRTVFHNVRFGRHTSFADAHFQPSARFTDVYLNGDTIDLPWELSQLCSFRAWVSDRMCVSNSTEWLVRPDDERCARSGAWSRLEAVSGQGAR